MKNNELCLALGCFFRCFCSKNLWFRVSGSTQNNQRNKMLVLFMISCLCVLLLSACATTVHGAKPTATTVSPSTSSPAFTPTSTATATIYHHSATDKQDALVTTNSGTKKYSASSNIADPYEGYNRVMFKINSAVDAALIRPATVGYVYGVPLPIRIVIRNFFNNLYDFVSFGNDLLQIKLKEGMKTFMRVSINSTLGFLGAIDVASGLGLKVEKNSFGKTFQTYGWHHSNYFVIPLLGPSTVRDALGTIPNIYFNPTWYLIHDNWISVGLYITSALDTRSKFLDTDHLLRDSLDPYSVTRDIYMQLNGDKFATSSKKMGVNNGNDGANTASNSKNNSRPNANNEVDIDQLINDEISHNSQHIK